jgi:BASS family bile acid:Na+ symporter
MPNAEIGLSSAFGIGHSAFGIAGRLFEMVFALISLAAPATAFILLAAVGLDLTPGDFARVRRQPALVIAGLVAPLVVLPPLAVALTWVFGSGPDVTASVLLVAACPIGGVSTTWSYLARASTALSVTLTGLSCLAAFVTIPLVGAGIALALARPFPLSAPIPVLIAQVVLLLGLPVAIGMWIRRRVPDGGERYGPALRLASFIGIGIVFVLVIADDPSAFASGLTTTVPLAAAFVLGSMGAGWLTAVPLSSDRGDRFTLAAEFGTRNIGVAMAIAVTLLGRVEFARFATTYALTEIPLMLAAVALFRRGISLRPSAFGLRHS